jgi:predicted PurR-regulated permease PerM
MINSKSLKQAALLIFILGLGYLLGVNLLFMLDAVLGAIILAILSMKPIQWLVTKKMKQSKAEWIYYIASLLMLLIPILIIVFTIKGQWSSLIQFVTHYANSIELIGLKINEKFGFDLVNQDVLKSIVLKVSSFVPKIINSTFDLISTFCVMYFLLYFFIKEGSSLRRGILNLVPLGHQNRESLFHLIYSSVLSNALMMPMVALVQAVLAGISYFIAGVNNSFIWFLATFLTAMIPFVGAALIYIPLGVLTYFSGHETAGIFIILWGLIVVSSSDNFLRMFLMKKMDDTHPLVTFLGVMAGLNIFGFLGIIFGPLLISLLMILIKIYREEYA